MLRGDRVLGTFLRKDCVPEFAAFLPLKMTISKPAQGESHVEDRSDGGPALFAIVR